MPEEIFEQLKPVIDSINIAIKSIISLLQYLTALYNSPEICLVVDELDSGIFEYPGV